MRCFNIGSIVAALALFLSAGLTHAAEKNPSAAYDSWAKLKPGSSVTTKMTTDSKGRTIEMEMTYTLSDVQPEKVILDVKQSMSVAGRNMDMPGADDGSAQVRRSDGRARPVPAAVPGSPTPMSRKAKRPSRSATRNTSAMSSKARPPSPAAKRR